MASIRETVDPFHTLPVVVLEPTQVLRWDGLAREKMLIMSCGEVVGRCDIVLEDDYFGRKAHFDDINLAKRKRGLGVGMATYLLAIELAHARDYPFETQDFYQSLGSKTIWEKLSNLGVAIEISPFRASNRGKDKYEGKFIIPVPAGR